MAFFSHALSSHDAVLAPADTPPRPTFFSRFIAAMMIARQRQADREIARYLELSGGKLTDAAEREIEKRFLFHTARY